MKENTVSENWLQLFAQGGEGGDGPGGGEGDPGGKAGGEAGGEAGGANVPAEGSAPPKEENAPRRMRWEEILADPEYRRAMEDTIRARLEEAAPKADEPDPARYRDHLRGLERQAAALRGLFPGLELRRELQNPLFARMTSPMVGIPVEAAYHAVHHRELTHRALQVAAEKTARQIASAIRSGARRPREAGSSAQAPSVTAFDYTRASQTQREDLKRRIRAGEKVSPGQEFR